MVDIHEFNALVEQLNLDGLGSNNPRLVLKYLRMVSLRSLLPGGQTWLGDETFIAAGSSSCRRLQHLKAVDNL